MFAQANAGGGRDARSERTQPVDSGVAGLGIGTGLWRIEEAGFEPRLVHAGRAKLMLGMVNKTDKLDARGLNKLQRVGTLPVVWIPPGEVRELTRTRMVLVAQRTQLKNRIHAKGRSKRAVRQGGKGAS